MAQQYGLTNFGFEIKQQQQIIQEINASLQGSFGANINLGPESVFGQLVGIFSEREALIWQLIDAVYASQYPSGAQGTSVDNILALNNLKRLQATPTKTDPTVLVQANGISLFGLVLYGTAGTLIQKGSQINNGASPPISFITDADVTINAASNAAQQVFYSNTPTQGSFLLSIVDPAGNTLTTPAINWNAASNTTALSFSTTPAATTHFALTLTRAGVAVTTGNISTNAAYPTSGDIQTAIQALGSPYSGVTVSGSAGSYTITWGGFAHPIATISNNTTTVTITPLDSVQALFNNLKDVDAGNYPYTDVAVSGFTTGLNFQFGANTPVSPNPSSGAQPQALMSFSNNSLQMSTTVTNLNIVNNTIGAPAQGVGSATCTVTGPNFIKAGTLNVIGSPVAGWTGVTNQLDCLTGTNVETDTEALQRRSLLLAANANGPLQSIVEKVEQVPGVTTALGFQNLTGAAQQTIGFASVPVTGAFTLTISGQTTGSLAYNCTSADVAAAINALIGFGRVIVSGNVQFGFVIDFNGSFGGQAIALATVASNTTGVAISIAFGRPPHSYEIVVAGGNNQVIAQAIYDSGPAGIQTYSAPILITTGSVTSESNNLPLSSVAGLQIGQAIFGPGLTNGTTIASIAGSTVIMSLAAIGTYSTQTYTFNNTVTITDAFNNPTQISFSRPTEIPFYVGIVLLTDQYNTPGNSGSGANPKSKFNAQTIPTIQNDIIAIGNAVTIGGLVIGFGTDGLIGAFNDVPGIVSYTLFFGIAPNPASNANIQLQAEQQAVFESFNCVVSYS